MKNIDWLYKLKPNILNFMEHMKSKSKKGYYKYSYSGDLYDESEHWNVGSSVFALKIYWTLGIDYNDEIKSIINYIESFKKSNGLIYDEYIYKKSFLRNILSVIKNNNFSNVLNKEYRMAETRQCYSSLMLYNKSPGKILLNIPMNENEVDRYLSKFDWSKPWNAGSHFSHLMFFLNLAKETKLENYAINWVNRLQDKDSGFWYKGETNLQQKINGAMKILTGLVTADKLMFSYPEKLIDSCLDILSTQAKALSKIPTCRGDYKESSDKSRGGGYNDDNACDNFNIIFVLNYASKVLDRKYRQDDIENFAYKMLSVYEKYYKEDKGGFSFYPDHSNIRYYGAKITKGLNEPDIHGTVLYLWGISIIAQILGIDSELKYREFKT